MTKAAIVPPPMSPLATASAPRHISTVSAPKTSTMIVAVIAARVVIRRRAVWNVRSTASAKRARSRSSWLNAWTTRTAPSTSAVIAPISATRSWLVRETLRSRRPNQTIGSTTSGIATISPAVSAGARKNR